MDDLHCESEGVAQEITQNHIARKWPRGYVDRSVDARCFVLLAKPDCWFFFFFLCFTRIRISWSACCLSRLLGLVWFWRQYYASQGNCDLGLWDYRAHSCAQV